MYVLCTGDRNWVAYQRLYDVLSKLPVDTVIIHGDADGADRMAHNSAILLGMTVIRNPAHWAHNAQRWVETYGPCPDDCKEVVGRPAGVIRNGAMLKKYPEIELVIAFHNDLANSRGTKDMVQRAVKKRIKTALFTEHDQVWYPLEAE